MWGNVDICQTKTGNEGSESNQWAIGDRLTIFFFLKMKLNIWKVEDVGLHDLVGQGGGTTKGMWNALQK